MIEKREPLLTVKELAAGLKRHPNYVYAMKRRGFPMAGYRATLTAAIVWLETNPEPMSQKVTAGVSR